MDSDAHCYLPYGHVQPLTGNAVSLELLRVQHPSLPVVVACHAGPSGTTVAGVQQPVHLRRVRAEGSGAAYDVGGDEAEDEEGGEGEDVMEEGGPSRGIGITSRAPTRQVPRRLAAMRSRLRSSLAVIQQHSIPISSQSSDHSQEQDTAEGESQGADGPGPGGWRAPGWKLQVDTKSLPGLVAALVAASGVYQEGGEAGAAAASGEEEQQRAAHEADTWRLLQVCAWADNKPSVV
jgi:hypothetical protein